MKKLGLVWGLVFMACGSSGSGGGGGGEPVTAGKQIPDEQVCREDSPCKNAVGTEEEYLVCMDRMRTAAQDPCRQAMVESRMCVVANTQCTPDGDPDNEASEAAWERSCKTQVDGFDACCNANPDSIFCAPLGH